MTSSLKNFNFYVFYLLAILLSTGCGGGGGVSASASNTNLTTTTTTTTTTLASKWSAPVELAFQCCSDRTEGIPITVTPTKTSFALLNVATDGNTSLTAFTKGIASLWQKDIDVAPLMPFNVYKQYYRKHQIYSDNAGNIFASWGYINQVGATTDRDYVSQVYVSRFNSTTLTWSSPYVLQQNPNAYADELKLYVQADGVAWATWSERTQKDPWFAPLDKYAAFVAKFTPQDGWSTPEKISADYPYINPKITTDNNGNPHVIFVSSNQSNNGESQLYYVFKPVSGMWSTPVEIVNPQASGNAGKQIDEFDFAADSAGNVITIWRMHDGNREAIFTRRKTSGSWMSAHQLMLDSNYDGFTPKLAMDKNGNAIAVWKEHDGKSYAIWAARFDRNAGWATLNIISSLAEVWGDDSSNPKIAFDDAGNAVAVWGKYDFKLNKAIARANRYSHITGWGDDETISAPDSGIVNPYSITLSLAKDGNGTAIWWEEKNNIYSIHSASFAP